MKNNFVVAIIGGVFGFLLAACIFLSLWLFMSWEPLSKCGSFPPLMPAVSGCTGGPVFPAKGEIIENRTPVFNINGVEGYDIYKLQVDSNPSFLNPKEAINLPDGTFILQTPLEEGKYFWRISCHSDKGEWLPWGTAWEFTIV